ncbi:MAG: hypothetical protein RJA22_1350 [Verrucomicrobiota bacterium]
MRLQHPTASQQTSPPGAGTLVACILAGGRSSRMGRDKARLHLGGRSLLSRIRATALRVTPRVVVIRRDHVPGCGPLGGVHTALLQNPHGPVLFLSCDMPFVSEGWMARIAGEACARDRAVFTCQDGRVGFPFALPASARASVEQQLQSGHHALQGLARRLRARRLRPPQSEGPGLLNINTPTELQAARRGLRNAVPADGPIPSNARPRKRRRGQSSKTRTRRRPS